MSTNKKRLDAIFGVAVPPRGSFERAYLEKQLRENPSPLRQRLVAERFREASLIRQAQMLNGSELQASQLLREFLREYNERIWKHDLHALPLSFNVMEAFFSYNASLNSFELRSEIDHMCHLAHMLDGYTASMETPPLAEGALLLPEGIIHSYDLIDPAHFVLKGHDGEYIVRSVSMIRSGSELMITMMGGKLVDPDKELREAQKMVLPPPPRWKKGLTPNPELKREPVFLAGAPGYLRIIFSCRYELASATRQEALYLQDYGDGYTVLVDDPNLCLDLFKGPTDESKRLAHEMAARINGLTTLTECAGVLGYLPWWFDQNRDDSKYERHATGLRVHWADLRRRGAERTLTSKHRIFQRPVLSLLSISNAEAHAVIPPELKIETGGYWKKLSPGSIGADQDGKACVDRTWVSKQLTWIEQPQGAPIAAQAKPRSPAGVDPGSIYVMRSAAHPEDVFKVGLTRRNVSTRAAELSSNTATLDALLPVLTFTVGDCGKAEKAIHSALQFCRVRKDREFFKISIAQLYATMRRVLQDLGEEF